MAATWQYRGKTWKSITPDKLGPYDGKPTRLFEHGVTLAVMKRGHKVEYHAESDDRFTFDDFSEPVAKQEDLERAIDRQFMFSAKEYAPLIAGGRQLSGHFPIDVVFWSECRDGVPAWIVGETAFPLEEYPSPGDVWEKVLMAEPSDIRPEFLSDESLGDLTPALLESLARVGYSESLDAVKDETLWIWYDWDKWTFWVRGSKSEYHVSCDLKASLVEAVKLYKAFKEKDTDYLFRHIYLQAKEPTRREYYSGPETVLEVYYNGKYALTADLRKNQHLRGYHLNIGGRDRFLGVLTKADAMAELSRSLESEDIFKSPPSHAGDSWPTAVAGKLFLLLTPGTIAHLRQITTGGAIEEHGIRCEKIGGVIRFTVREELLETVDQKVHLAYHDSDGEATDAEVFTTAVRVTEKYRKGRRSRV
jgi:hypothetical protein